MLPRTIGGALAMLGSILRFALRRGYIVEHPLARLEAGERPRPPRRRQRALGHDEITRLLAACLPRYRTLIATALYTGMRISEVLGLIWEDVDFAAGLVRVSAQLSRASRTVPARRVPPKTPASHREIPLVAQLGRLLREHKLAASLSNGPDYVFATSRGCPLAHRNVNRRALTHAARAAGIECDAWPPLRFHDLRHTFASHLIIDLGLDVAQVSRILGHARVTTTLDVYTHLFDDARHAAQIRAQMTQSSFAALLSAPAVANGDLVVGHLSKA